MRWRWAWGPTATPPRPTRETSRRWQPGIAAEPSSHVPRWYQAPERSLAAPGPSSRRLSSRRVPLRLDHANVERLGATAYLYTRLAGGEAVIAEERETAAAPGAQITLGFDMARVRLFGADGQRIR